MKAGNNASVYIRLCSSSNETSLPVSEPTPRPTTVQDPTPRPTTPIDVSPGGELHGVFDCTENYTNITSPSFASFDTSADEEDATIECMARCQASDQCNY